MGRAGPLQSQGETATVQQDLVDNAGGQFPGRGA
jgi:hypothetical protein